MTRPRLWHHGSEPRRKFPDLSPLEEVKRSSCLTFATVPQFLSNTPCRLKCAQSHDTFHHKTAAGVLCVDVHKARQKTTAECSILELHRRFVRVYIYIYICSFLLACWFPFVTGELEAATLARFAHREADANRIVTGGVDCQAALCANWP